jgi:cytochrome c oxidase subunit 2
MLGWLPERASTYAGDVDSILALIYSIVLVWFFLIHGLLVYVFVRFRRGAGRPARHLTGERLRQSAWILAPCVLVLGLDLWIDARGARVWTLIKETHPEADVSIRVTGKQFNWEVLYPGPDARFGTQDDLMLENALDVPAGRVVGITLESRDVLHSFFLPQLRLKQDAVPGRSIPIWFEATEAGRYEIACAELCGFGHTGMRGLLTVHTPESWEEWVAERWPARVASRGARGS